MKNLLFIRLNSGLGNLMFQIATAYAYSLKNKKNLIFHKDFYTPSTHKPISFYLNNIFSKLDFKDRQIIVEDIIHEYQENTFDFSKIPDVSSSLILNGYFQSYLYFEEYEKEIKDFFNLDFEVNSEYLNLLNGKTCSIHIRLGDYLNHQDAHPLQAIDYYKSAMQEFDNDTRFLVFSDNIEYLKENNFLNENLEMDFHYIENQSPHQDLKLMSLCNNNIIANSTFSWWAAYLNKNINKKIIYPTKWFTSSYAKIIKTSESPKYLFPKNWKPYD